jgi:hypothetical protein
MRNVKVEPCWGGSPSFGTPVPWSFYAKHLCASLGHVVSSVLAWATSLSQLSSSEFCTLLRVVDE